jgi:hypothetical protein
MTERKRGREIKKEAARKKHNTEREERKIERGE